MSVSQIVPHSSESTPSGSGYPNSGRGRGGGRFGNIQCQVCFEFGHIASYCYHRFNQQFQPAIPHECHGQVGRHGLYEFPNLKFLPIHQLKPVPPLVLILVLILALVYTPLLIIGVKSANVVANSSEFKRYPKDSIPPIRSTAHSL
ncbi:transmembrane protein, putative [Medicago truncatula]|uniref:Transmembrane protein, putative n=1 Tax=Medicago truncatula TaxID=3880 RepID=A0A072V163_MEDTR|nr:transmembrane protein, putative [Medicago truncatula]